MSFKDIDTSLYINYREIDGYNCPYNIISTTRGYGKSYGVKKKVVRSFDRYNKRFGYLFRRKVSIDKVIENGGEIFTDYNEDFNRHIYFNRRGFYEDQVIDNESVIKRVGYNFIVNDAQAYKNASYRDIGNIWYEECVIEKNSEERYIRDEPTKVQNICDTIIRNRNDVKVYLTCNALESYNPFAIKWHLKMPDNGKYIWVSPNKKYLVYVRVPEEFIEARKQTLFGSAVSELDYAKFSFGNQFITDNNLFIMNRPKGCRYLFTISTEARNLGIWTNGRYCYASKDYERTYPIILSASVENREVGSALIGRGNKLFSHLIAYLRHGLLFFDTRETKDILLTVIEKYM